MNLDDKENAGDGDSPEAAARRCCIHGLRILAYITMLDGIRTDSEFNIEISVIESRLATAQIDRRPEVLEYISDHLRSISPTRGTMARSIEAICEEKEYFNLIYNAAWTLAGFSRSPEATDVISRLRRAGQHKGWI